MSITITVPANDRANDTANDTARDAMCGRATDEITFQAGLLALHAAILSASTELKNPPEEFGPAPYFDGPHPGLVEVARRPAGGTEPS